MTFNTYGNSKNPSLLLIPGLGVSYEIFIPMIELTKDKYYIVAVGIDGFLLGKESQFTSVDDHRAAYRVYSRKLEWSSGCCLRSITGWENTFPNNGEERGGN